MYTKSFVKKNHLQRIYNEMLSTAGQENFMHIKSRETRL